MDCSNCGNVLAAGAKHCNKCGAKQYDQHMQHPGLQQAYNQNPEMRQPQKQNPGMQQPFRQHPGAQQTHNPPPATQQVQNQSSGVQQLGRQPGIQQTPGQSPEMRQLHEQHAGLVPTFGQNPKTLQPDKPHVGMQQTINQNPEMRQPYKQPTEFKQTQNQHPGVPQSIGQRPAAPQMHIQPSASQNYNQKTESPQPFNIRSETSQPPIQRLESPPPPKRSETSESFMQHLESPQQLNQQPGVPQQLNQQPGIPQQLNQRPGIPQQLSQRPEIPQQLNQRPDTPQQPFNQRSETPQPFHQRPVTPQQPFNYPGPGAPGTYYQNPEMHHPGTHAPPQTPQPYAGPNTYAPTMRPAAYNKRKVSTFAIGIIAGVVSIGVLFVVAIGLFGRAALNNNGNNTGVVSTGNNALADSNALLPAQIFENNVNGVFKIYATSEYGDVVGSGFFVDAGGIAVTNHHVMVGATRAIAILEDGREIDIVGYHSYDISNDLAVIQLDNAGHTFHYLTIGDSDAVQVGQEVYAIGSPLGDRNTFTVGYVSRFATEPISFDIYTVEGLIQMTAAIYGGSSGGVLLNDRGHVIGVNTAGNAFRPSVGWSVPISRLVLPESGSAQFHPLPIEEPIQIRREGIFTYERYPFIPDFLSVAVNSSLILSGTAETLEWDLVLDFDVNGDFHFSYAYMYDLENWSFLPVTDAYDEVLMEHGFIFQGALNDDDVTYVLLYHEGENTTLAYCYYWDESVLLVLIGEGNAYEVFRTPPPELPAGAVLDHALMDTWLFMQTSNPIYQEWQNGGESLFYIFNADGSGEFITEDRLGRLSSTFEFIWYTENDSVIIEYYGFFTATYVYRYRFVSQGLQLTDAADRHILQRVE